MAFSRLDFVASIEAGVLERELLAELVFSPSGPEQLVLPGWSGELESLAG